MRTTAHKRIAAVEDLLRLGWVGEPQVSLAGTRAVYVEQWIDAAPDENLIAGWPW